MYNVMCSPQSERWLWLLALQRGRWGATPWHDRVQGLNSQAQCSHHDSGDAATYYVLHRMAMQFCNAKQAERPAAPAVNLRCGPM
jgi:hypothetical protein